LVPIARDFLPQQPFSSLLPILDAVANSTNVRANGRSKFLILWALFAKFAQI
jgi:hypothetical protein